MATIIPGRVEPPPPPAGPYLALPGPLLGFPWWIRGTSKFCENLAGALPIHGESLSKRFLKKIKTSPRVSQNGSKKLEERFMENLNFEVLVHGFVRGSH